MNLEPNSLCIQNNYSRVFYNILHKQFKKLHSLIGTVIQEETWIEFEKNIKNKIVKKIQDDNLKNVFIKNIEEIFKIRLLSQICEDNEKLKIIGFLKMEVCVSQLSQENFNEILSLSEFQKAYLTDPARINFLDKKTLNHILLEGYNIEEALNNIKIEELTDENLFSLLEIYKSIIHHSDTFCKTYSTYLKQKIGAQNIILRNDFLIIQIEDLTLINTDNLEKYIALCNNHSQKAKIFVDFHRNDNYENFINKFKNDIYSIQFVSSRFSQLSPKIGDLTNLRKLTLIKNQNLKTLPKEIEFLINLTHLDLSECSITTLPREMGNLTKLEILNLSKTEITEVPKEIEKLSGLWVLNLTGCSKLRILCSFEHFKFLNLSLPKHLDNFTLTKIAFEKNKKFPENTIKIIKDVFPEGCNSINIALNVIKNLQLFNIDNFDFIYSLDLKKSDLNSFNTLLTIYRLFPEKRNEIRSLLFNTSDQLTIIDQILVKRFRNLNKEFLEKNFQITTLEEYITAQQLQLSVNQNYNLSNLITNYLENKNEQYQETLILTNEIINFLQTAKGKKILKKYKRVIFNKHVHIKQYILKNFCTIFKKHAMFYPIFIREYNNKILIQCTQSYFYNDKDLFKILTLLSQLKAINHIHVLYWNEDGSDHSCVKRNFLTNLFQRVSKNWNLYKGIQHLENKNLALLGPLLKYIYDSPEGLFIGDIFDDCFFRGMVLFDYEQTTPESILDDAKIQEILLSGYNTKRINKEIADIFNFLDWNFLEQSEENYFQIKTLINCFVTNYLELDQELINLIGTNNYKKKYNNSGQLKIKFISNKQKIKAIEEWLSADSSRLEEIKKTIRETVLEDFKNQVRNLHILVKSINFNQNEWETIKRKGFIFLKTKLQGEFSKEKLLEKILYTESASTKTKMYLTEWIESSNTIKLKKFLKFVTGSPSLPIHNISICSGNQLNVNTCFWKIDIPNHFSKHKIFEYMNMITESHDISLSHN